MDAIEVIAGDCGRNGFKGVSESQRIYFPTARGRYRELRNGYLFGPQDMDVEYAGNRYFVGRVAAEEARDGASLMISRKAHFDTKLYTLTGIHRLVNDLARVFLVTGVPISLHYDQHKNDMKKLLLGAHELIVNGVHKHFTIERVEVAAEGATAAWWIGNGRKDRFHVVDVGSRTVNYTTMVGGRWLDRDSDSFDYGFETFGGNEEEFARCLVSDLSKWLQPLGPIVLIGGKGSLVEHLKMYHEEVEAHQDALFANACAFRELGVMANARTATQTASR